METLAIKKTSGLVDTLDYRLTQVSYGLTS